MSIIFKTIYVNNVVTIQEPVIYVDTINENGYISEMTNIMIRYIRNLQQNDVKSLKNEIKIQDYLAKDICDVQKKKDGLWIVYDAKTKTTTLVEKTTSLGYIYNSTIINNIFTLSYKLCKRVVPQLIKNVSLFDSFKIELSAKVGEYKDRVLVLTPNDIN